MIKHFPAKIIFYLTKEFIYSFLIVLAVFLSLSFLINFIEEMSFFKEKKIDNLILMLMYLSLYKTPNTIIDLSMFIFLFSGSLFFVKIKKNNEMLTILLSGISKKLPILVPATTSFILGITIVLFLSPLSSSAMRFYENTKRLYSYNDNLIVMNNNGLWFMENLDKGYNIIRADKISNNNFFELKNITIYNLDTNFNFIKRIDGKSAYVDDKNWILQNTNIMDSVNIINEKKKHRYADLNFVSTININDLKNFFSNESTVSFYEINSVIKQLNDKGYSAEELKIKLHKYISLPIYFFAMILLSTNFTLNIKKNYNTMTHLFFGLIVSFFLFFLNDLSIAIGLSNKLPIQLAIWTPALMIIFFCIINLFKANEL